MSRYLCLSAPVFALLVCPMTLAAPIQAGVLEGGERHVTAPHHASELVYSLGTEAFGRPGSNPLMHTDLPDLPDGRVPRRVPDELSDVGPIGWIPGHLAPSKNVVHHLDDNLIEQPVKAESVDLIWPDFSGPSRVHTDVPDLPDLVTPNTSDVPFRKPGWGDFSNLINEPKSPPLERSTIPTPSSLLVLCIGGAAALRRRRS
ncbi:MAG: hypothetical protein ACIAQF_04530 [Phycisphaerales bacterium JB065]